MKRFKYQGLGSILAGLLLAGCASTGHLDVSGSKIGAAKRFVALEASSPPVGAMAFCAADPSRCGPQAAAYFGQGGGVVSNMVAVGGIEGGPAEIGAKSDAFRYMIAARRKSEARKMQAQAEGVIFVTAAESVRVTLTEDLWAQLKGVQAEVNAALRPATDRQVYGKEEVWALPLEENIQKGAPRGDCEDYALEKRLRLLNLGWAPQALSIVIVEAPRVGPHAVLVVSTDRGEYVLDNLRTDPVLADSLAYNWQSRQTGLDLLAWTRTSLVEQVAPDAPQAETVFAGLLQARIDRAQAQQDPEQDAELLAVTLRAAADQAFEAPALIDVAFSAADIAAQADADETLLAALAETEFAPYQPFAVQDESPSAVDQSVAEQDGRISETLVVDADLNAAVFGLSAAHERCRAQILTRRQAPALTV